MMEDVWLVGKTLEVSWLIEFHFIFTFKSKMTSRLVTRSCWRFAISKFSPEIESSVLPTAPQLNSPQVIDTKTR